jgi:hypothetical protein
MISNQANKRDLLGNYLAVELVHRIWEFLSMPDLLVYGNTSAATHTQVQDFIRRKTNDEIGRLCQNPEAFRSMLWKNKSIISGSVALAALIPDQLCDWQPSDMDIYTTSEMVKNVVTYLEKVEGYKVESTKETPSSNYAGVGGIKEVLRLTDSNGRWMDVIICDQRAVLSVLFGFYGTQVFNAITGHGLICLYPAPTFGYRSLSNSMPTFLDISL